jgi:hypothetical protein
MKPDYEAAWNFLFANTFGRSAMKQMEEVIEKYTPKEELRQKMRIEDALYQIRTNENLQAKRKGWMNHVLRSVNGVIKKYYPNSNRYCQYLADNYDFNKQDWSIEEIPIIFQSIEEARKAFKTGKFIKHENWDKWYHKDGEAKILSLETILIEMQEDRWMIK